MPTFLWAQEAEPNVPREIGRALAVQGSWDSLTGSLTALAGNLVLAGLILAVTIWAAGRAAQVARLGIARLQRHHPDPTLQALGAGIVRWAVVVVGLIAVLQQLGVQATSVIAVLGAASLAVGLALQGTLSNVAAGVMILVLRPYRVGDDVEINGQRGVVNAIDLFTTKLRGLDGQQVFIPNGLAFQDPVINRTALGSRRIELVFNVAYEDDLDAGRDIALTTAKEHPKVLSEPGPWAHVTSLNDSSVSIMLRAWVRPGDYVDVYSELLESVKARMEAAGLSFPYPHQVAVLHEAAGDQEEGDTRSFLPARARSREPRQ